MYVGIESGQLDMEKALLAGVWSICQAEKSKYVKYSAMCYKQDCV